MSFWPEQWWTAQKTWWSVALLGYPLWNREPDASRIASTTAPGVPVASGSGSSQLACARYTAVTLRVVTVPLKSRCRAVMVPLRCRYRGVLAGRQLDWTVPCQATVHGGEPRRMAAMTGAGRDA